MNSPPGKTPSTPTSGRSTGTSPPATPAFTYATYTPSISDDGLVVHRQEQPATAAPGAARAAVGPGARHSASRTRPRPHRVSLDQGDRSGRHRYRAPVSARPPGDQRRPPAAGRRRQTVGRDRLRDHLPGLPPRRRRTAGRLAAGSLDYREQRPSRPRRDPA